MSAWYSTPTTTSTSRRSCATIDRRFAPRLTERRAGGIRLLVDDAATRSGWSVAFTDREGGTSEGPYSSLNLSTATGDSPAAVALNRRRVAAAAGVEPERLRLIRQVHGTAVVEAGVPENGDAEADAVIVREPGAAAVVLTADCVPVVLAGRRGIAVVHAGWRGLVAGVVDRAVEALGDAEIAWVGPAIAGCCYEVGPEVVEAFASAELPVLGPRRVDPASAATAALRRNGIDAVARADRCTSCDRRYFSFRRDGVTGRQAAVASILA